MDALGAVRHWLATKPDVGSPRRIEARTQFWASVREGRRLAAEMCAGGRADPEHDRPE